MYLVVMNGTTVKACLIILTREYDFLVTSALETCLITIDTERNQITLCKVSHPQEPYPARGQLQEMQHIINRPREILLTGLHMDKQYLPMEHLTLGL